MFIPIGVFFFAYLILIGLTIFQPPDFFVRNAKVRKCVVNVDEHKSVFIFWNHIFTGDFSKRGRSYDIIESHRRNGNLVCSL